MSAPSTSFSFSLDAHVNQRRVFSPPSSRGGSRPILSLNLASPVPYVNCVPPLRSIPKNSKRSILLADRYPYTSLYPPPLTCSPPKAAAFLGPDGLAKLRFLDDYCYAHELPHGSLAVRVMTPEEVRPTVEILASSFADAMWIPLRYVRVLEFLVEQYVVQKRAQRPYAATLVGYYREKGAADTELAGTAEVSFNAMGGNVSPPSPVPPRNAPYICNMTVKENLRRRGIGWHLLKACEELISKMSDSAEVYLHCRVIDNGPLSMYVKAGYSIVKTDNIFVWLRLQRRKHLMCKELLSRTFDFDDQPIG